MTAQLVLRIAELTRLARDARWTPLREGVDMHTLYDEGPDGPSAALLRYAPGAYVPAHRHAGYEHVLVVDGSQEDERGRYLPGTLVVNPPGSRHSVKSPEGCLVLVMWQRPVVFDDPAPGASDVTKPSS